VESFETKSFTSNGGLSIETNSIVIVLIEVGNGLTMIRVCNEIT
jgi:hypothetical protein